MTTIWSNEYNCILNTGTCFDWLILILMQVSLKTEILNNLNIFFFKNTYDLHNQFCPLQASGNIWEITTVWTGQQI